jgi:hypothetical protein
MFGYWDAEPLIPPDKAAYYSAAGAEGGRGVWAVKSATNGPDSPYHGETYIPIYVHIFIFVYMYIWLLLSLCSLSIYLSLCLWLSLSVSLSLFSYPSRLLYAPTLSLT